MTARVLYLSSSHMYREKRSPGWPTSIHLLVCGKCTKGWPLYLEDARHDRVSQPGRTPYSQFHQGYFDQGRGCCCN